MDDARPTTQYIVLPPHYLGKQNEWFRFVLTKALDEIERRRARRATASKQNTKKSK